MRGGGTGLGQVAFGRGGGVEIAVGTPSGLQGRQFIKAFFGGIEQLQRRFLGVDLLFNREFLDTDFGHLHQQRVLFFDCGRNLGGFGFGVVGQGGQLHGQLFGLLFERCGGVGQTARAHHFVQRIVDGPHQGAPPDQSRNQRTKVGHDWSCDFAEDFVGRECDHKAQHRQNRCPERAAPDQPCGEERVDHGEPDQLAWHFVRKQHGGQRHKQQHKGKDRTPVQFRRVEAEHQLQPAVFDHGPTGTIMAALVEAEQNLTAFGQ